MLSKIENKFFHQTELGNLKEREEERQRRIFNAIVSGSLENQNTNSKENVYFKTEVRIIMIKKKKTLLELG